MLRQAQYERILLNQFKTFSVRPELVEALRVSLLTGCLPLTLLQVLKAEKWDGYFSFEEIKKKSRIRLLLLDFLAFCFVHPT